MSSESLQRSEKEEEEEEEEEEERGAELSGILLHLSHPAKHCLTVSMVFLQGLHCLAAPERQIHTCSLICECMEEREVDQTWRQCDRKVKQRESAWSDNIAIIL